MKFKEAKFEEQLKKTPIFLQNLVRELDLFTRMYFGIEITVTRVSDPLPGESGVHPEGRAVDLRDEHDHKFTFNQEQRDCIVNLINARYPRNDGKKTCIHHRASETSVMHFHIQLAADMKTYV